MADTNGRIAFANQRVLSLFGYERDELLGLPVERLLPPRFRPSFATLCQNFFAAPAVRLEETFNNMVGCRKGGEEIRLEISLNSVLTAQGQFVLASMTDVTERWRAEEALQRLQTIIKSSRQAIPADARDIALEALS